MVAGAQKAGADQGWQEMLLEPCLERFGSHGAIIGLGRNDTPQARTADESDRFVMAVRNTAAQPHPPSAPAIASRHVGRRAGLVDKHEFQRIEVELAFEPLPTSLTDVGTVLFARLRRLFFT
jgi:hypothetical protein